jgi:hypothetical protein
MASMAAAIIACFFAIIVIAISCTTLLLPAATTGRRPTRVRRRLKGLKSYLDPKTVELRTSVVEFASMGSFNPVISVAASRNGGAPPPPPTTGVAPSSSSATIPPYDVDDAILSTLAFRYTYFFFVYDSTSDVFHVVHNVPSCDHGCARIHRLAHGLSYALRANFPDRIHGSPNGMNDLVVMLSCGDAPRVKVQCLTSPQDQCGGSTLPPVLQFGSVFREHFPSMIAMPLPVRPHMPCFDEWQEGGTLCRDLQPMMGLADPPPPSSNNGALMGADKLRHDIKGGMPFGEELGIIISSSDYRGDDSSYWDALIPQVIWRGTDFNYLHTMYHEMRSPEYQLDIAPRLSEIPGGEFDNEYEKRRWAIQKLWEMGDDLLLPRWRGVLLTSEAELEAAAMEMEMQQRGRNGGVGGGGGRDDAILPWANIKFATANVNGIKTPASQCEEYLKLQELGISAIGEYVSMVEQARYKYHIDLGGGGGTTWTGTIEKLAMPGLLFHHVTPTRDWFHDLLVPWEHYVPVAADLSDLRRKYEWAESHPVEARQIAESGTRFARWMGSADGFGRLYEEYLVTPLRDVIIAYRPMPPMDRQGLPRAGKSVLDVIIESGNGDFKVVSRCTGLRGTSCEEIE